MQNFKNLRKLRYEARLNICLTVITIFILLVWIFFDLFISTRSLQQLRVLGLIDNADDDISEVHTEIDIDYVRSAKTYHKSLLQKWKTAPVVREMQGVPGEMGRGVEFPPHLQNIKNEKFKENQFNLLASDLISLNRSLPDVRHPNCKNKYYPGKLPTTSIVIVFHNEARTTLLRTVWSIINRSPRQLLREIILVDDASVTDDLGQKLEEYVKTLPVKTFVVRAAKRTGLIRGRLLGAKNVTGETITFLDSHCECSEGWLEPLLERIAQNRHTVVCPLIDRISDETFEYMAATDDYWGGFDWLLRFQWFKVPDREMKRRNQDRTAPLRTPVMAGGLFSIDKEYFYEIGSYDAYMNFWGGENLEMSFRIWQCGGTLEIIPCSHVGHVYREMSPYSFPLNTIDHNNARLAEVWLDEWREFFYFMRPDARRYSVENISERKVLRESLQCKSFRWYLENVYPESVMPLDYNYIGVIRNAGTQICVDTMRKDSYEKIGTSYCHGLHENQIFIYTKEQKIISNEFCLEGHGADHPIYRVPCNNIRGYQQWIYNRNDNSIRHKETGKCLTIAAREDPYTPLLKKCDHSRQQQWIMDSKFKWQVS